MLDDPSTEDKDEESTRRLLEAIVAPEAPLELAEMLLQQPLTKHLHPSSSPEQPPAKKRKASVKVKANEETDAEHDTPREVEAVTQVAPTSPNILAPAVAVDDVEASMPTRSPPGSIRSIHYTELPKPRCSFALPSPP